VQQARQRPFSSSFTRSQHFLACLDNSLPTVLCHAGPHAPSSLSRRDARQRAFSPHRPCPALASVVCVLMLPCVCPFLVRLSLLASLVCLSLFSSEIGDISLSWAAPPPRSPSARPACTQPARPPRLRFMWCALRSSCAGHGVVSDTIGSGVGCQSVVLLSVAVALSATHHTTPHPLITHNHLHPSHYHRLALAHASLRWHTVILCPWMHFVLDQVYPIYAKL
jgi:hypothetical protein